MVLTACLLPCFMNFAKVSPQAESATHNIQATCALGLPRLLLGYPQAHELAKVRLSTNLPKNDS